MPVRKSSAVWNGTLKDGNGSMKIGDGTFEGAYTSASRFEEGKGTNPEQLLGAAHAGCFSMALALNLEQAGFKPEKIETTAVVHLNKSGDGFAITDIELQTEASVPGIDENAFREQAEMAKKGCPVSQLFQGATISLKAALK
jgi:lipoyl-dependent peroxiredoxin